MTAAQKVKADAAAADAKVQDATKATEEATAEEERQQAERDRLAAANAAGRTSSNDYDAAQEQKEIDAEKQRQINNEATAENSQDKPKMAAPEGHTWKKTISGEWYLAKENK